MSSVKEHFILGLVVATMFLPLFGWQVVFIVLANSLMDADHFIRYWIKRGFTLNAPKIIREWSSLMEEEEYSKKEVIMYQLLPFHTWEFLAVVWVYSLAFNFYPVAIGMTLHWFTDYTYWTIKYGLRTALSRDDKAPSFFVWFRRYFEAVIAKT